MILYFSGTGNSAFLAQELAQRCREKTVSLNEKIKQGDYFLPPLEKLILVLPTYGWRIPRIVEDWLTKADLPSGCRTWFVMNCGSEIGNAPHFNKNLCQKLGLLYLGTAKLVMPENYIAMFSAPEEEEARRIIEKALPALRETAATIFAGRAFQSPGPSLMDRGKSRIINPLFYRFSVRSKPFYSKNTCIGCGLCSRLCPVNGIRMRKNRPQWTGACTHCMACICHCPAAAIEYGTKSLGKPRYLCPMGKEKKKSAKPQESYYNKGDSNE